MKNIEEKMLEMVVDMATQKGKMEAHRENLYKEIEELRKEVATLKVEIAKRDALLCQQESAQPKVVVNQFFVLSVPRTRDYVGNLNNDGRQFVSHMLNHTLAENSPRSAFDEVNRMTELRNRQDDGKVVIHHNTGPVGGDIKLQNVRIPLMNNVNMQNRIEDNGGEEERNSDSV